jgi:hypothetical protein
MLFADQVRGGRPPAGTPEHRRICLATVDRECRMRRLIASCYQSSMYVLEYRNQTDDR